MNNLKPELCKPELCNDVRDLIFNLIDHDDIPTLLNLRLVCKEWKDIVSSWHLLIDEQFRLKNNCNIVGIVRIFSNSFCRNFTT